MLVGKDVTEALKYSNVRDATAKHVDKEDKGIAKCNTLGGVQEMTLLAVECEKIVQAKNRKVVPLLGGKKSNMYNTTSLRGKIYRDLEGQFRREFGVTSYKVIRRNQTDRAVELIMNYELPLCLAEQVLNENAQIQF